MESQIQTAATLADPLITGHRVGVPPVWVGHLQRRPHRRALIRLTDRALDKTYLGFTLYTFEKRHFLFNYVCVRGSVCEQVCM